MNESENLVPKRRFKEFTNTGTWEQRKLGDMVEFFSGLTYSPDNVIKQPGTLVLRSSNVQNGEIVNADNVYVDNEVVNSDNVQVGDIAVVVRNGSRSLIGKHAAIKYPMKDTVIGAFMTGVRSDTPSFTNALLDTQQFETEIAKNLGATINQITTGNFKKMIFNFPEIDERLRIGDFFNQLDNTIALHQRKLEKSKALKSAYLSEMFPAEGERKPKRRFAGFTDDWEQRKLGERVTIKSGWSPSNFVRTNSEGSELFIKVDDLNYSSREQNDSQMRVNDNPRFQKMKKGSTIFPKRGAAIMTNKVRILSSDAYMDTNMMALEPQEIDGDFLYTFIDRTGLYKIADTSTIPQINNKHIEPYIIYCPSIEEQTKVGSIFKKLDDTIALHQHKLEKLKNIKQAYLNEMFI